MILGAEDKLYALEYELYSEVRETIAAQVERIQKTAKAVGRTGCIYLSGTCGRTESLCTPEDQ